jgi:hypothetical protein
VACLSSTVPKELRGNSFCRNEILKFFLFIFQKACLAKLNRVKPSVNSEKLQKKEKKKRKKRKKERKLSIKTNNS